MLVISCACGASVIKGERLEFDFVAKKQELIYWRERNEEDGGTPKKGEEATDGAGRFPTSTLGHALDKGY